MGPFFYAFLLGMAFVAGIIAGCLIAARITGVQHAARMDAWLTHSTRVEDRLQAYVIHTQLIATTLEEILIVMRGVNPDKET